MGRIIIELIWGWGGLLSLVLLFSFSSSSSISAVAESSSSSSSSSELFISISSHHTLTLQLSSLLLLPPYHSCNTTTTPSSTKGLRRQGISLEVRHRFGPCSQQQKSNNNNNNHVDVDILLERDEARVTSIRNRVKPKQPAGWAIDPDRVKSKKTSSSADLPAKSGSTIGSGNFFVTVGLGTPKKDISLIFDTGSDFTWTQCKPCAKRCYKQKELVFDPSESTTYSNISCNSAMCSSLRSATSATPGCSASTCLYGIQYGDSSFSVGYFAKDTLHLGPTDAGAVPNFMFGCGQNNQGLFGGSAGLLGLGRNHLSVVSQTSSTYGNYFSYCLPSKPSSTGHLTFGRSPTHARWKGMQYTSMGTNPSGPSFYFLELVGIKVGGQKLSISKTVFSTAGTLIDSGTVITRLPPDAYSALQSSFSKMMRKYPKAPSLSILDTCYDFTKYRSITVPKISLLFKDGAEMELHGSGIFYAKDISQVCLAFVGNSVAEDVGILGNIQQMGFEIAYDVAGGKLGFAPAACP